MLDVNFVDFVNFVNILSMLLLLVAVTCQVVILCKLHKLNSYLDLETYSKVYKAMLRKREMDVLKRNSKNKHTIEHKRAAKAEERERARKAKADKTKVVIKTG